MLTPHVSSLIVLSKFQSAYRLHHSTETAVAIGTVGHPNGVRRRWSSLPGVTGSFRRIWHRWSFVYGPRALRCTTRMGSRPDLISIVHRCHRSIGRESWTTCPPLCWRQSSIWSLFIIVNWSITVKHIGLHWRFCWLDGVKQALVKRLKNRDHVMLVSTSSELATHFTGSCV